MRAVQKNIQLAFCLLMFLLFFSCQKEGEPLTLDDIYAETIGDRVPFRAKINGFDFKADAVAGGKEGSFFYIVGAQYNAASITLYTIDITPQTYLGKDSANNYILFKNDQGRLFSSNPTAAKKESDAEITIRAYSEKNSLASGTFSATLYSLDSDEELAITQGKFNSIDLVIPFFGKMNASIDNTLFKADRCFLKTQNIGGITLSTINGFANNDTTQLSFTLEDTLEVKSYDLMEANITAYYSSNTYAANTFKYQYQARSGNLNIAKIDTVENRLIGSFNFEAINNSGELVVVKSGNFEAQIK